MQKIVLFGGPGSGKSSVAKTLEKQGYHCFHEVSREIIRQSQKEGIEQLFLKDPILFSQKILEGREQQFIEADKSEHQVTFFDRGIPSVEAYLKYCKTDYPSIFTEKSKQFHYDIAFHFIPEKNIYTLDNERYETFEQALEINQFLKDIYSDLGHRIIEVPFDTIENRCKFVLDNI